MFVAHMLYHLNSLGVSPLIRRCLSSTSTLPAWVEVAALAGSLSARWRRAAPVHAWRTSCMPWSRRASQVFALPSCTCLCVRVCHDRVHHLPPCFTHPSLEFAVLLAKLLLLHLSRVASCSLEAQRLSPGATQWQMRSSSAGDRPCPQLLPRRRLRHRRGGRWQDLWRCRPCPRVNGA